MSDQPIEFFIFDILRQCFYKIFLRSDDIVAHFPFQMLQSVVDRTYKACNATLARMPHIPTPSEQAAMTAAMQWAPESPTFPQKYQLQMAFDPKYQSTTFLSCFNNSITTWIVDYQQAQTNYGYRVFAGVAVFVVAVAALGVLGYFIFKKHQENKRMLWGEGKPLISFFPDISKRRTDTPRGFSDSFSFDIDRVGGSGSGAATTPSLVTPRYAYTVDNDQEVNFGSDDDTKKTTPRIGPQDDDNTFFDLNL